MQHPLVSLPAVAAGVPALSVALPHGPVAELGGALWPQAAYAQGSAQLGGRPFSVEVVEIERVQANRLLEAWAHPLGAYRRPFGQQHFLLLAGGQEVALACSGSVRRPTVAGGLHRQEVVELARIARHPEHPRSLRVMLRLWTDYLAARWPVKYPGWQLRAAVSYALPGKAGNLYRFDGWAALGETRPWAGSTGWSGPSRADNIADGRKRVWVYHYPRR